MKRLGIGGKPKRGFAQVDGTNSLQRQSNEESLLVSALDSITLGVALVTLDGRLLKVNPALCQILGYSPEAILALGLSGITYKDDWQKSSFFSQAFSYNPAQTPVETRYLHSSGQIVYALTYVSLIRDNDRVPLYLLVQIQDVTKSKQDEVTLLRSQSILQGIVYGMPDAVFIKDFQGRYLIINVAGAHLFNKTVEDIIGKDDTYLYAAEEAAQILHMDQQIMSEGVAKIYETTVTLNGVTQAFLFTKTPYYGTSGEALGLVVVARDITEHQQASERLENSRAELRALSAQLQSVREEERLRIAREIHDELGQVLTGLKMDVVSLSRRLSDTTQKPDWELLKERAQAIAELINDAILTVRRISTELRPGLLDVMGLTAAIEWQAQEFVKRTAITCNLQLPQTNLALDQSRSIAVFRIFQEILTNVARHAQATKVDVTLTIGATELVIEAKDNGRGIKAAELSNPKSLGVLGMRERTLLLAGQFKIWGAPGRGTTVTVRIPLTEKSTGGESQSPRPQK